MIETNLIIAIFIISETDLMSIDKLLMKKRASHIFVLLGGKMQ